MPFKLTGHAAKAHANKDKYFGDDMAVELQRQCHAVGGQAAWAKLHGLSPSYVSDLIHRKRDFSHEASQAMGFQRIEYWVRATRNRMAK